jgi:2-keto-4-pentenoate hydratase/2-oxohepta-3-ene-1,7-dioic acid hydratase in catechol pathway
MPVDAVATEVAKKIANTRRILGRVTDADLETCIAGYAALDDDSARAIVRLCENELTARAAASAGGVVVWRLV